ncbi:alpha/beta hydrolase [Sphingobacterium sp. UBA7625]|uniref:alpha/beta hydrolase n=1 Tax=Sphingobacterium sp. UBA7625 TaxID=1947522 RepID=UPI00257DBD92|nr:alpha/beta hydrolase [Sphingobacterium sp. UBA7625]
MEKKVGIKKLSFGCIYLFISLILLPCFSNAQNKTVLSTEDWTRLLTEQLFPGKKTDSAVFQFDVPFEEKFINVNDNTVLHSLLFKAKKPKGVIFYLHGSNNALDTWGKVAPIYTSNEYDVFMLDYRGYGKSQGKVTDEDSLYQDIQIVYDKLRETYSENQIIVLGQSMGTALASYIAAKNNPNLLILQAPYYNMKDWTNDVAPELDTTNIPYNFDNASFLKKVKCPVIIFHGNKDTAVYYGSSVKLSKLLKATDQFITLQDESHNDFSKNEAYLSSIKLILERNK